MLHSAGACATEPVAEKTGTSTHARSLGQVPVADDGPERESVSCHEVINLDGAARAAARGVANWRQRAIIIDFCLIWARTGGAVRSLVKSDVCLRTPAIIAKTLAVDGVTYALPVAI